VTVLFLFVSLSFSNSSGPASDCGLVSECSSFLVRSVLVEALAAPGLLAVTTRAGLFCGASEPPLWHPWGASGRGQWPQLEGKGGPLLGQFLGTDSVPETVVTHAGLRGGRRVPSAELFLNKALHKLAV